ncbi:long-chain fatty acid--CoA ligase [Alteromonas aestuariivivens]|uniref:Long-chain-fatty-acid--CoA ligase n=1 Tax=Alteromonas aestuariivivens TaxID=1938339 RepID=A0A3D8MFE4_9ALTE|nr:AMP-binding protein [Alteromonas aestuariivivens]RDV28918.1 long-chain fatty acid--CoA ligase [Alteromonas aestuariivivens]
MLAELSQYQNLNHFLNRAFERHSQRPAFSCLGQTLTFGQIDQKASDLAAYFQSLGLQPGDRIAIQLPNLIQYPIAVYAALRAGLIIVNTNPLYTPREMLHQFNDSGAKAIVILEDLVEKLEGILPQTGIEHIVVTRATDLLFADTSASPGLGVAFNQALALGGAVPLTPAESQLDDLAALQYTGGTTGVSKGAQLTHRNLIANAIQTADVLGDCCREAKEVFVCPLPLYHIYAFLVSTVIFASRGNHSILIPNPRDISGSIEALRPHRITGFAGLNTLFVGLCSSPEFKQLDFSQFRLTISGGTALTSTAAELWQSITGCMVCEGYGLSETSPVLALNQPGDQQIGSVGRAVENTDIQFWDDNDQPVADGQAGQLVAKGPQVMKGYWQMPEETAKALTAEGYFKTGDVGLRLPDGRIKIIDRLKDMIIVSGFNVYPNEVEEVLVKHPTVLEAAVIGEADERSGEKVIAYVTPRGEANEATLIEFCRQQLTGYKVPKTVRIVEELPKSSVGKILRRELRK